MPKILLLAGLIAFASCDIRKSNQDILLAQVFDKRLFVSEVKKIIPSSVSREDSILAQNAYIERWIKESVMMHEAEKNVPADLEIDQLAKAYKSSLVLHQFEKFVVENTLDTVIKESELSGYYEANKSQYLLESTIVRCHLIKVPADVPREAIQNFETIWLSGALSDFENLLELCNTYASNYFLDDSIWYKLDLIQQEMPEGAANENVIRNNKVLQLENDDYYYFLKILEIKDKKEIAPLTFIQEQASKVILHQRKIALLAKLKEDLYERASSRNSIKLFTK